MARFCGEVGFGDTVETAPGVWEDVIIERKFFGDVPRNTVQSNRSDSINDDSDFSTSIDIVASNYAFSHLKNIRYIKFDGELWEIDRIEVKRPRLILSLGGVYNGPTGPTPNAA